MRIHRAAWLLAMLAAGSAAATEVYDTGEPYDGQVVAEPPGRIVIRFTEPVRFDFARLDDADGRTVEIKYGLPEDDTDVISIRVPEPLPPGGYRLYWQVYVTGHRHEDDGTVNFTVLPRP